MDRSQWHLRPNTQDEFIYNEVYVENCYRLPDDMSGIVVIDVGANIGAFAVACLERGAEQVICFEPDFRSYQILVRNHLIRFEQGRWTAIQAAIAGEFRRHSDIFLSPLEKRDDQVLMTGSRHITSEIGETIGVAFLIDFLSGRNGKVWLKLDCEGSEHEILADNLPWDRIERIFGECHKCGDNAHIGTLTERLESVGYQVEWEMNASDSNLHLFFANQAQAQKKDLPDIYDTHGSQNSIANALRYAEQMEMLRVGDLTRKTVCILTPFRNARRYLPLYFSQMSSLQSLLNSGGYSMRIVAAEGDSLDGTRERLVELAQEHNIDLSLVDTTHGKMKWASVEDPVRLKTMSDVMNKALGEVKETDDVVVWIMSDLKWEPESLALMITESAMKSNKNNIYAPWVFVGGSEDRHVFYDTWAYRMGGERFTSRYPFHREFESIDEESDYSTRYYVLDSAGTCLVMRAAIAKTCRTSNQEAVSLCEDARSKGFNIVLNTHVSVYHAPLPSRRLLWISDAVCISGFSRVAHAMFPQLTEAGYDLDIIALNYFGEPHNFPYTIYPASVQGEDLSGNLRAKYLIYQAHKEDRPYDLIIKLDDPWNVKGLVRSLESLESEYQVPSPPVLAWVTVDGKNIKAEELNHTYVLSCTEFGLDEISSCVGYGGEIKTVSFGVDTSIFQPLDKIEARSLVSSQEIQADAFIVGVVGTNQLRKRLDLVLSYFSSWINQYQVPNAYLYLCLGPNDNSGFDINSLKDYYGLKNRIIWNPHLLSDQALALVYNSFDVYLSLSQGEGFGLPTLEAMACGVPCVVSNWSGYSSWVPESVAYKIPCTSTVVSGPLNVQSYVIGGIADKNETIGALQKLYLYPELREKMGKAGIEFAKGMSWKQTGDMLIKEVEKVISRASVVECLPSEGCGCTK